MPERNGGIIMSKILFDEHPLVIPVETATKLGLEEAIILQQVHYWLQDKAKEADPKFFHDGRYWVYDTYDDWKDAFPFWSLSTIRRKIGRLEKSEILLSAYYNENATIRKKWYSIDYDKLEKAIQPEQMEQSNMSKCNCSDRTNATVQNEQMDKFNMSSSNNIYNKDNQTKTSTKTTYKDTIAEKSKDSPQEGTAIISLLLNDKSEYQVMQNQVDEWKDLYPAVDIVQELRSMKGWIIANPSNRKTRRGILRFITNWLNRAQNRAPRQEAKGTSSRSNPWGGVQ